MHFCSMLKKLQAKWKVNGWNLLLILVTFAIGGSLCGFLGRKILLLTGLEKNFTWFILYIVLITLLWPFCVMLVSLPLGQFSFFKKYLGKMRRRILPGQRLKDETRICIFASGAGTNAQKIIEHFSNHPHIRVTLIVSNKRNAGVIDLARHYNIEHLLINKDLPLDGLSFVKALTEREIDLIVLAGFLLKIPPSVIKAFKGRIINIHPALLPAYGGRGMYGKYVHEAVIANKEKQSGISIHYVDEIYDHGEVIFQAAVDLEPSDTVESLAKKIQTLEHANFPAVIETVIKKQKGR